MRIVQGQPTSWNLGIGAKHLSHSNPDIAWSPCSRFIAITSASAQVIEILDAMTLSQVTVLGLLPGVSIWKLLFSPDGCLLTGDGDNTLITFNLQTGVIVSAISKELPSSLVELIGHAYSACGTMVGILTFSKVEETSVIYIYNILSGTHTHTHSVRPMPKNIWTHGDCLQFATVQSESITIWEVGFTSEYPAIEVQSLPTPNNFDPSSISYCFHPTLSWLIFGLEEVYVWDAQNSKLMYYPDAGDRWGVSFSSDGHFACKTVGQEIYLWVESPTGHILHHKPISSPGICSPLLSPNGQSIVMHDGSTLQLWHTKDIMAPSSSGQTQAPGYTYGFILEFSPDKSLVAIARFGENMATVLDLESGIPQLIINTGMKICGLKVAGSTIVVIGDGQAITWNLPTEGCILNARAGIADSVQTITFDYPSYNYPPPDHPSSNFELVKDFLGLSLTGSALISPNLHHMAVVGSSGMWNTKLYLYSLSTGQCHTSVSDIRLGMAFFTPDGHEIWCDDFGMLKGWSIVEDSKSNVTLLEHPILCVYPSGVAPWKSSHGYNVMGNGWILSSNGKRLLWLPPHWRTSKQHTRWGGQFLTLLHCELPEVVILELLKK